MKNSTFRILILSALAAVSMICFIFLTQESARLDVDQQQVEYSSALEQQEEPQLMLPDLELARKTVQLVKGVLNR